MPEKKYTPHVHAEIIKAWADGKPIEWRRKSSPVWEMLSSDRPGWYSENEYRVKPEEVVSYTVVFSNGVAGTHYRPSMDDAKLCYFTYLENFQGFCKRTTIDGKVVALEFIPR